MIEPARAPVINPVKKLSVLLITTPFLLVYKI
jgi:hypothetical protein